MNEAIAKLLIENCHNDYLFEQFALEICSEEHRIEFLPTSQSWDRGRDGRSSGPSRGSHRNILCSTLNRDVDAKVEADMLRLTATSSPDHVVYCCSQYLSEEKADEIEKTIRRHAPTSSLTVYGSLQLARLAHKFSRVFENRFHAEIETMRQTLELQPDAEDRRRSLRLALLTVGHSEGAQLRRDMLETAILECLVEGKALSPDRISQTLSGDLGLPRRMRSETITASLVELEKKGLLEQEHGAWRITVDGTAVVSSLPAEAADALLRGRIVILETLEQLTRIDFPETQFEQIWSALLDFLSSLFYQNGLAVIQAFETFLNRAETNNRPDEVPTLNAMLREGAHRIAVTCASVPDHQVLIETAISDMLTEREGPAFEWLVNICERFVTLCCLGIESRSAAEIRNVLTEGGLILDTDIILTYMCPHASDHAAVRDLLTRWKSLGGKILLAPVVLEEVAYHAWISISDFRETRHLLGTLRGPDRYRYVRNAFAREFHALGARENQWDMFIGQYRGNSAGDYTKIRTNLLQRLGAGLLPDSFDPKLAEGIKSYLVEEASREGDFEIDDIDEDTEYKLSRDGRLLASIAAYRRQESALSQTSLVTILSSSSGLRKASLRFAEEFCGDTQVVFSRANFAYLLSMIPEAQLGVDSLRRALFDFGRTARLRDTERRALRIIKSAGIHDISWAERPLLAGNLKKSIHDEASRLGVDPERIKRSLETGEAPDTTARVIVDALGKLSRDPKQIEKLKAAENRIAELEGQIAAMNDALRHAKSSKVNPH